MKTDLHVRIVGAGAPVLILLHGLGMNGSVWEPFLAHLAGWPGRIMIPDLRGHGRSTRTPIPPKRKPPMSRRWWRASATST